MTIDLGEFIAGGYFLSRHVGPDWTGTPMRRVTLANGHTPRRYFPDDWTLSWCRQEREKRRAEAAGWGIDASDLDALTAWADGAFGVAFGAWNVLFTLDAARAVAHRWLARAPEVELWGVGLRRDLVRSYCAATAPPPPVPGYSPMGSGGTHLTACARGAPLAAGGTPLGFEVLFEDLGSTFQSPQSLHCDEEEIFRAVGVTPNGHGLLATCEDALACCRYLVAEEATSAHPFAWFPWLLVAYPRSAS
jgi:hypothetical protein